MDYHDYFPEKHTDNLVSMDDFISEAMRTDLHFNKASDQLSYLQTSKITIKNELLTCYQFLKEKGLLEEYHKYRDGE